MLTKAAQALVDYLKTLTGAGGLLEGVKTIQTGQRDPLAIPSGEMPCITVSWGSLDGAFPRVGAYNLDGGNLNLCMYTVGGTDISKAHDKLMDLLIGTDGLTGLIPAIAVKQGFKITPTQSLSLIQRGKIAIMYGQGQGGYMYGASVPFVATTRWSFAF